MRTPERRMVGKLIKGNRYLHVTALGGLAADLRKRVQCAAAHAGLSSETDFNVIKIDEAGNRISLLSYDHFFDTPFPALQQSCVVDLASGRVKHLRYDISDNPPILHRKELLLPADHPQTPLFAALTQQLEATGLLRDVRRIGFARQWQARLQTAGYEVRDHQLVAERCSATGAVLNGITSTSSYCPPALCALYSYASTPSSWLPGWDEEHLRLWLRQRG